MLNVFARRNETIFKEEQSLKGEKREDGCKKENPEKRVKRFLAPFLGNDVKIMSSARPKGFYKDGPLGMGKGV